MCRCSFTTGMELSFPSFRRSSVLNVCLLIALLSLLAGDTLSIACACKSLDSTINSMSDWHFSKEEVCCLAVQCLFLSDLSMNSVSENTSTKKQSHYPEAPNVNCALRSLCWGIPRWFCWTNRRLEWIRRPSDSCGGCDCVEATATFKWLSEITGSSDSFCVFLALCAGTPSVEHSKVRIAEPFSLHITWKKLTLCARG